MVNRPLRRSCRNRWRKSSSTSGSSSTTRISRRIRSSPISARECRRTRQNNADLSEFAGLRFDLDSPRMLLDNNVVTDREAEPGAFPGGLGREEGIEHLLLHLGWNTSAVIADLDLD